eukprot:gene5919-gene4333
MEAVVSRMLFAAAILGIPLFHFYFFFKIVRRRLSSLNRGRLQAKDPANLNGVALGYGQRLLSLLQANVPRKVPDTTLPASATLITDASLDGWVAILHLSSGNIFITGARWSSTPFLIMQAESRAVALALRSFASLIPTRLTILVDNTSLLGAARKGHTKSRALAVELEGVQALLQELGTTASYGYVRSENNTADAPSRGLGVSERHLAMGHEDWRGGDGDPWL